MNKNQVKGTVKEVAGKVQAGVGKAIGNNEQHAKGHVREAEGKAQHAVGDVKEMVKDATHKP